MKKLPTYNTESGWSTIQAVIEAVPEGMSFEAWVNLKHIRVIQTEADYRMQEIRAQYATYVNPYD